MRKLRVHYMDCNDNEVVAEIDAAAYVKFLSENAHEYSGSVIATRLDAMLTVTNTDPRDSELEDTDVFISFVDVKGMITSLAELFVEIPEEFVGPVVNDMRAAETKS